MHDAKWASTVPRGAGRTSLGLGYETLQPRARDFAGASVHVDYRTGLSDRWDLGGHLSFIDARIGPRTQLARDSRVEASLGTEGYITLPRPAGNLVADGFASGLEVPLRLGVNISRRSQVGLGVAPRLAYAREVRSTKNLLSSAVTRYEKSGLLYSGRATLAVDIGLSDHVHLVPYASAEVFYGTSSFTTMTDTVLYQAGLDVSF